MEIPEHLRKYPCSDYFDSEYAKHGFWCEPSQLRVIVPATEIEELRDCGGRPLGFLCVGRPGVDSISFGYREGRPGLWVYHPIEGEVLPLAATIIELVAGWISGTVIV